MSNFHFSLVKVRSVRAVGRVHTTVSGVSPSVFVCNRK